MGKTKIEIDFAEACSRADTIESIAADMQRLANQKFATTLEQIDSAWKGECAAAYLQKAEYLKEEMSKTAQSLYAVSGAIRDEAQRLYDAEKNALNIVQGPTLIV